MTEAKTFPPDTDAHGSAIGETRPVPFATRPLLQGTLGMVAAGHYLAAAIGLSVLEKGGNAVDAGVATGFALALLKPQSVGIGGEAPILIHLADQRRSVAINGQGWAPRAATIDWFKANNVSLIPSDGLLPAMVPAQFASWCTALQHFGTKSLADVLGPAVDLAEGGFPVYSAWRNGVQKVLDRFKQEWPTSAAVYLTNGQAPVEGALHRNPDWARSLKGAIDASLRAGGGREDGIQAALEYFYAGPIAQKAAAFAQNNAFVDGSGEAHRGLLTEEDFADYGTRGTRIEEPVRLEYHGIEVLKCGPWSQGPVLLQHLKLLEGFPLAKLGHNTAEYLHVYLETGKLAFSDRERYYGDPAFVNVPMGLLLSEDYAAERRELVDERRASLDLRPGSIAVAAAAPVQQRWPVVSGDTTHVDAVDRWGNLFSATPSGGWIGSSPVVEGLGFPLGTRGQMFYLDERHANALAPGKRPRTTLTPSMALRGGEPWMAFGTPGGDQQDQWALQFFLNVVDFGMELQEALDAPTVQSTHFPGSFYPHAADPGGVRAESRIPSAVLDELRSRGHKVDLDGPWSHGQVTAVAREQNGVLSGAASPRGRVAYVMGR